MKTQSLPEQKTVPFVEINRFMGPWYVIANIPTVFEKGAYNAVESYAWNEKENRIDINFTYNNGRADGPVKSIPQKGFIYDEKSHAEWRVQPWWPFKFAYLIVDLAPDYSDTIVGVPDRGHVWIMSRTPKMDDNRYQVLVEKVRSLGYDISALQKVPQIH